MVFTSWRGVVGVVKPTHRPGSLEEFIRLLPEGIGVAGEAGGRSRSVYTGLIRVDEGARGTDARQTNRNLKLSEDAWAESVPNLEIRNNDVRCSHASAVGPVDEEQRWYLESRGVPTAAAERLIVRGFFEEVLAGLPVPAAAPALRAAIDGKLARSGLEPGAGA